MDRQELICGSMLFPWGYTKCDFTDCRMIPIITTWISLLPLPWFTYNHCYQDTVLFICLLGDCYCCWVLLEHQVKKRKEMHPHIWAGKEHDIKCVTLTEQPRSSICYLNRPYHPITLVYSFFANNGHLASLVLFDARASSWLTHRAYLYNDCVIHLLVHRLTFWSYGCCCCTWISWTPRS